MTRQLSTLGLASLIAFTAIGAATASAKPVPPSWALTGPYSPSIDPANFVRRVDNRDFPLQPGTRFHFVGHKGRTRQIDNMVVTHRTKRILGVRATVVRDTVLQNGTPIERTFDWYAQDRQGNVWYMGEDSLERHHGHFVRASDSWKAGVKGAKPGIIMLGHPRRGDVYRQEFFPPGDALDQAHVNSLEPLTTVEWSPTEPQLEKKTYVAGVGEIAEKVTQGGNEAFRLVSVTKR
jgi:hypothetical protein